MVDNNDYRKYLSIDNGKGLLISKETVSILTKYNINYQKYTNITNLIFDINNYLNNTPEEIEDLEEILIQLSESNYYNNTKK